MLLNQVLFIAGFFITPAVEKTKTQGKNSTSRSHLAQIRKTQEKTHTLMYFFQISRVTPKYAIFITKCFQ